jgi:hypothetical protein
MNTPRKHFAWIRQTAAIFGCEAIMESGKLYIKHNGVIVEKCGVELAKSWCPQHFIELFERISGKKQSELWKETK